MACALLVTLPLWVHGPSCGQDFDFHLQSWLAASAAWHSATGPAYAAGFHLPPWPHWMAGANYGAGEPRFLFYPPLSWLLGALLGALLPWTATAQAFTLLALSGCGLAFYQLARTWVRPAVAVAAACVYLANPYLLFVAYERSAYGELLSAIAVPLVLLYALRPRPDSVRLALVVAALWLTNAPSAVMGCYLAAFCACSAALAAKTLVPLLRSSAAIALGSGLAAVYIVPAWYEQRWVEIARVVGPGMRVEDSFLFGHSGEPYHDQVLHTASGIALIVLGAGLLATALWSIPRGRLPQGEEAVETQPVPARPDVLRPRLSLAALERILAAILLAILLLQLPWSDSIWRVAPELRFLQFPWRWLLVGGAASTLALATLLECWLKRALRRGQKKQEPAAGFGFRSQAGLVATALATLAIAAGAGQYAQHAFAQVCDDEDNVNAQLALLAPISGKPAPAQGAAIPGFEGSDEYTPKGADNGEVQKGLPAVRLLAALDEDEGDDTAAPNPSWQPAAQSLGTASVERWAPEHKRVLVATPRPAYIVLRLMDYPAWQVQVNGVLLGQRPHREDGLLIIPVQAGTSHIEVNWRVTEDVLSGRAVSLASLLGLGLLGTFRIRKRHRA